jgi:hypothetical protein
MSNVPTPSFVFYTLSLILMADTIPYTPETPGTNGTPYTPTNALHTEIIANFSAQARTLKNPNTPDPLVIIPIAGVDYVSHDPLTEHYMEAMEQRHSSHPGDELVMRIHSGIAYILRGNTSHQLYAAEAILVPHGESGFHPIPYGATMLFSQDHPAGNVVSHDTPPKNVDAHCDRYTLLMAVTQTL